MVAAWCPFFATLMFWAWEDAHQQMQKFEGDARTLIFYTTPFSRWATTDGDLRTRSFKWCNSPETWPLITSNCLKKFRINCWIYWYRVCQILSM
jgi:hypothetical protein